jgi:tetratricopeptide (TPR) repeat protein
MKSESSLKNRKRRKGWMLKRVLLASVVALCLFAYYHERIYLPDQMLKDAISNSSRSLYEAEKLVIGSIEQAGGVYPDAELFRTQLLVLQGRGDEGLGQFSLISNPEELSAEKLCDLGRIAQSHREMLLAEKAFSAIPSDSELYTQVLRSLIQIHLEMGKEDQTLLECRQLVNIEPQDATAWQVLGTIAMNRKDLSEAVSAFRSCLSHSTDPKQLREVREDLIQVLIDEGNTIEARKEMSTLVAVSGTRSPRAVLEEAYLLRLDGRANEAIAMLEPLVQREDGFQVRAMFLRGLLYADIGAAEKAVADLTFVTNLQPWHKEAHHKLSVICSQLGNTSVAEEHRKMAEHLTDLALELLNATSQLAKNPADMEVRTRVAFLYEQLGQPEQAQRLLGLKNGGS